MREHPIGFQHVAMLSGARHVAFLEHGVDRLAEPPKRDIEPRLFLRNIFGEQLVDGDARLVQHHMPERDAVGQRAALQRLALRALEIGRLHVELDQHRADQLRQHHGRGLERLDLFIRIAARRCVLKGQHADRAS